MFDTFSHCNILSNLVRVGVSGSLLKWFTSYFSGHQQQVLWGGSSSLRSSGVHFRSPALLTVHGSFNSCPPNCQLLPPLVCWRHPVVVNQSAITIVTFSLISTQSVTGFHLLAFSWTQTRSILWSWKRPLSQLPLLYACGPSITQLHSFTYLGGVICSNLSWATHTNNTYSKAKKQLSVIYRHFHLAVPGNCTSPQSYHYWTTVPVFGTLTRQLRWTWLKGYKNFLPNWQPNSGMPAKQPPCSAWLASSLKHKQQKLFLCNGILPGYLITLLLNLKSNLNPT